jgi:ornithine cyclodeaminase/alanine dehydrogenase-like protein (mu-crystallin family)
MTKRDVHAQLGDIVTGKKKGRMSAKGITLFDAMGLAIQNISCAYVVYKALKGKHCIKSIELF